VTLRSGTLVEAIIVDVPSLRKNKAGSCDPKKTSTKKGNDRYFSIHVDIEVGSGVMHKGEITTAKKQPQILPSLRPAICP
jgi:IS5 family transposase